MLTPLPEGVPTGGLETTGADIIRVFINLIIIAAIGTALWFLLKGGMDIMMSEGQKEKLKSGRDRIVFALLGLILVFLSFLFMNILSTFFGIDFLCLLTKESSRCL